MSHDNYYDTLKAFLEDHGYGADKQLRKNAVLALEIIVTFSKEAQDHIDIEKWLQDNVAWVRNNFNAHPEKYGDNALSGVYHADESVDHCHFLCACIDDKGSQNASYYIDGREKLQALQDSYAEVMNANHNLERGTRYSPAVHQDIQRMYGSLNKALNVNDIPTWEEKDTPETYQGKIREYTKDKVAVFHKQLEDKQRELEKANFAPKIDTITLERELASANRKIKKMEKDQASLERELGTYEIAKKSVDVIRLLKNAIENMPIEEANAWTNHLNALIVGQRRKERQLKEAHEKRKKNSFESIL